MSIINFKAVTKGILLSLAVSIIALFVLAVLVFFLNISDSAISNSIFVITALSVFLGAFVLAKNIECRGLLNGLVLAVGYFAVLLILSLIINGCVGFDVHNLLRLLTILGAGMLGGVLGINN